MKCRHMVLLPSFRRTPESILILASQPSGKSQMDSGFRRNDGDRARGMVAA